MLRIASVIAWRPCRRWRPCVPTDSSPSHRPEWEGILMHGVYHLPKGLAVDESVAWGEHFFVEALVKVWSDARKRDGDHAHCHPQRHSQPIRHHRGCTAAHRPAPRGT